MATPSERNTRATRASNGTKARPGLVLWAPLAVFLLTLTINIFFEHARAVSRGAGVVNLTPFFVFMFIYAFVLYYYAVYGLLTLVEKRFPDEYRGASGNFRGFKGFLSLVINLVIFGVLCLLPNVRGGGMISLSFSPAFIWGIPGFLFESGVKRCADSIASDAAARSHHPERESLEELKARGYNIQVNHAVFDHRGGVVVHFDVSHPRHHVIHTERFFRFTIEGKLDKSFSTPGNIPRYEHVLPLPDGRFLFYPDRGENGELPALMQDKGKDLRVTIRGAWELKVPRVIGGNTILGIDGVSLVRIRLPDPMRDGVRLEAERIVTMKDGIVPGHHVDSFTFRPAADGRILLALDMDNDDPSKPGMTLLANFSPSGRLLSKRVASGIFVHDFDYGACIDPAGGLLYVRDPGGGVFIARIRPDGREDAAFNGRFIATCGYFYMIMSVASDREGRILVTGRASPGNKPTVLLVDRGGRKIRTIYGD